MDPEKIFALGILAGAGLLAFLVGGIKLAIWFTHVQSNLDEYRHALRNHKSSIMRLEQAKNETS